MRATQITSTVGTLLFLLRGKKAVRGFIRTSALLMLLQESILDMLPFLGILLFVCVVQALALWHLQHDEPELSPTGVLDAFRFGMGAPNDELYPSEHFSELWLLYVVWNLFLVVVMLNSLIAILGDTYDRVMEYKVPRGILERARLILAIEEQMSQADRRRDKYFPHFVHAILRREEDEKEGMTLHKATKSQIESVKADVASAKAEVKAEMASLRADVAQLLLKLDKHLEPSAHETAQEHESVAAPHGNVRIRA